MADMKYMLEVSLKMFEEGVLSKNLIQEFSDTSPATCARDAISHLADLLSERDIEGRILKDGFTIAVYPGGVVDQFEKSRSQETAAR